MNKKSHRHHAPILVAIDFSSYSTSALLYAAELAEALKRPLQVLHVVHDPGDSPGYYSPKKAKKQLQRMEERAKEMFEEFMQQVFSEHSALQLLKRPNLILVSGLPVTRILEIEQKLTPFMLVMGSKGRTGLAHLMLGSKAEQIVQLAKSPVTIVKNPTESHR